jgi:hypothetical protein
MSFALTSGFTGFACLFDFVFMVLGMSFVCAEIRGNGSRRVAMKPVLASGRGIQEFDQIGASMSRSMCEIPPGRAHFIFLQRQSWASGI